MATRAYVIAMLALLQQSPSTQIDWDTPAPPAGQTRTARTAADCNEAERRAAGESVPSCVTALRRAESSANLAAYAEEVARRGEAARAEAARAEPDVIDIPATALRDPYGWVLSNCSSLVLPRGASPARCEDQHWTALRQLDPNIGGPRPASSAVTGSDPATPSIGTLFNGRCRTVLTATRDETSSSSTGRIVCGNDSEAAQQMLDSLLR